MLMEMITLCICVHPLKTILGMCSLFMVTDAFNDGVYHIPEGQNITCPSNILINGLSSNTRYHAVCPMKKGFINHKYNINLNLSYLVSRPYFF